jgi:KaiC/GvpD/RAD55 family RecA-like ATPase
MPPTSRLSTGVTGLDQLLGGGLFPGTLTVVAGATGIGKTQLGLQFAHAGRGQDGRPGIVVDMTCRGDPQSHADYARRMFGWELAVAEPSGKIDADAFFSADQRPGDYLHVFDLHGRRVTRNDVDEGAWRLWQAELAARLGVTIGFFYGNFIRGCRRAVIDGLEPVDRASQSIQLQLFDYIYHQILRKDPDWVARDLLRQDFRRHADAVAAHPYDPSQIGCLALYTSRETMLDDLISRPIEEGDLLASANTVIYLGRIREGARLGRGLYIAKHRGSACSEEIVPYTVTDRGLEVA